MVRVDEVQGYQFGLTRPSKFLASVTAGLALSSRETTLWILRAFKLTKTLSRNRVHILTLMFEFIATEFSSSNK